MVRPSFSATLLLVALVAAMPLAAAQDNQTNQSTGDTGPAADYAVTLREKVDHGDFLWAPEKMSFPAGSRVTLIYNSTGATAPHNIHVTEGADTTPATPIIDQDSGSVSLTFQMPASGVVRFVCDVHPETMKGSISVGEFGGGAGGGGGAHTGIVAEGVHFLAYWVGVIAFAALFILYAATFFLFKYNESSHTTDHRDRASPAAAGSDDPTFVEARSLRNEFASLFIIVLFVALVAYIVVTQGLLDALRG
ncbi:MAG TPA: plastocyanin/azurin family copper-binding protein [Candidatus Thermoplasmatota archaeon]|nr:plastocyanin/azurin family copper-binding protein [Candidatus Thermoplasmatota archaeon]